MSGLAFNSCASDAADAYPGDGSYLFNNTRDPSEYCALGGVLSNSDFTSASDTFGFVDTIFSQLNGTGMYVQSNFSVPLISCGPVNINRAALLDVNNTSLYYGGLGLAQAVPAEPLGFLGDLVSSGIIFSDSYSLWFSGSNNSQSDFGQLLPGIIDKLFYSGNLYVYEMIDQYEIDSTGNYVYHPSPKLPIVALTDVEVLNPLNGKLVLLKLDPEPVPVLWSLGTELSYLPLAILIQLAIQVSALYSGRFDRWIVPCEPILQSSAEVQLTFGPLKISVPVGEFVTQPPPNASVPKFPSGDSACFLNLLSSNVSGSNLLGLSVLRYVYLAVDNESNQLAMASAAKLDLDASSVSSMVASATAPVVPCTALNASSLTVGGTIGYIRSGIIPFATSFNVSSTIPPFAFEQKVWPSDLSNPAWLSGDFKTDWSTLGSSSDDGSALSSTGNMRLEGSRRVSAVFEDFATTGLNRPLIILVMTLLSGMFIL